MKKLSLIIKTILLTTVILLASACGTGGTRSKDECLQEFFSNAQAGRWTSMYQQLHPNHSDYNASKSSIYWTPKFTTTVTYSVTARNGDTYELIVNSSPETYKFEREDTDLFSDGYWSIRSFTNGTTTIYD